MTRLLQKSDGRLDWQIGSADELARQVQAYTPWQGTFTTWEGRMLKVQRATALASSPDSSRRARASPPTDFDSMLAVVCRPKGRSRWR